MRIKKADYNKHGGIDYDCLVENTVTGAEDENIKKGCREEPINTLNRPVTSEQSERDLSADSAKLVDTALQEVEKYINGERKYVEMPLGEGEPSTGSGQEQSEQKEMAGV